MIKYKLKCRSSYCTKQKDFDGWFQNIETFEKQLNSGLINCPLCGSENVLKLLTTPSLKKIQNTHKKITKNNVSLFFIITNSCLSQGKRHDCKLSIIEQ